MPPMGLFLTKLLPALLSPVNLTLYFCLIASWLAWKRKARMVAALAFAGFWVLFLPAWPMTAQALTRGLERNYPPPGEFFRTSAIVLLGGAMRPNSPPRRHPEINEAGDKLLHAARLWKQGTAPWLVASGGKIPFLADYEGSEAVSYAVLLTELFGVPPDSILLVDSARNTFEEAVHASRLFERRGLPKEILLVTSALHMPRAARLFRKQGFTVHPAPADFRAGSGGKFSIFGLIPGEAALNATAAAMHEYLGMAAYKMMGRL